MSAPAPSYAGGRAPSASPPVAALVPCTVFVRNVLRDNKECLFDILPSELYGVLSPEEYSSTIADLQAAIYPEYLQISKLWAIAFLTGILLVLALMEPLRALWIPLLVLCLLLLIGFCIRARHCELAYARREADVRVVAEQATDEYNSAARGAALGGGGGWRIEWSAHRELSDCSDFCGTEGAQQIPFSIRIELTRVQEQQRMHDDQVEGLPSQQRMPQPLPSQLQHQAASMLPPPHQQWQPTPHHEQLQPQEYSAHSTGLATLADASTEADAAADAWLQEHTTASSPPHPSAPAAVEAYGRV